MATINENFEPIYLLITSISFIILSLIQNKNVGKSLETIYLSGLSVFFIQLFCINYSGLKLDIKQND